MAPGHDLKKVASRFDLLGDFLGAEPYGSGHINDTYAVRFDVGGSEVRYIIQRINHLVFKDPPSLMENIERVTSHIAGKLKKQNIRDVSRRVMKVIPTRDNKSLYQDPTGLFWRAYIFIEKAKTYDVLTSPRQAYEAAKAFGGFQRLLIDLKESLHETIPNFHHGKIRYQAFLNALDRDALNRAAGAREEIDFLKNHAWVFNKLIDLKDQGALPLRATHNDCKINNVLMDDKTGEGICVIDLDTLMPGLALYDFGDMVRTSTCIAREDEQDLNRVKMDMEMFKHLARGYLEEANAFLNGTERSLLAFSGKMITLLIGARFLTDYLEGDPYFKVARERHNLERARTQFQLVRSITEQEEEMTAFVNRI